MSFWIFILVIGLVVSVDEILKSKMINYVDKRTRFLKIIGALKGGTDLLKIKVCPKHGVSVLPIDSEEYDYCYKCGVKLTEKEFPEARGIKCPGYHYLIRDYYDYCPKCSSKLH